MDTVEKNYQVKTPIFEGPLEVLLDLIEKRKLLINEISLSQVTDDYVRYVQSMPRTSLADISGFIVVAATLLLIKSKSLLPALELTEEETEKIQDLERRLLVYKKFKEVGAIIRARFGEKIIFFRPEGAEPKPIFIPDSKIAAENILGLARELIAALPAPEQLPETEVKKALNLKEVIENLEERIKSAAQFSFRDFAFGLSKGKEGRDQKVHIIVSFLALLELVRRGLANAFQKNDSGDIEIRKSWN